LYPSQQKGTASTNPMIPTRGWNCKHISQTLELDACMQCPLCVVPHSPRARPPSKIWVGTAKVQRVGSCSGYKRQAPSALQTSVIAQLHPPSEGQTSRDYSFSEHAY
jgi:hypothetical protein